MLSCVLLFLFPWVLSWSCFSSWWDVSSSQDWVYTYLFFRGENVPEHCSSVRLSPSSNLSVVIFGIYFNFASKVPLYPRKGCWSLRLLKSTGLWSYDRSWCWTPLQICNWTISLVKIVCSLFQTPWVSSLIMPLTDSVSLLSNVNRLQGGGVAHIPPYVLSEKTDRSLNVLLIFRFTSILM